MNAVFVGLISFAVVPVGVLCIYEYTLYTAEQRAQVPRLSKFYLGVVGLLIVYGLFGIASIFFGVVDPFPFLGILALLGALPAIVQNRMHRKMGVEQGPLVPHVTEHWL